MSKIRDFINDSRGDAIVVEAAILFPVMIMIFAGIFLVSAYLPQRAILQEAAQFAAAAVATSRSDTWITFDAQGNRIPAFNSEGQAQLTFFQAPGGMGVEFRGNNPGMQRPRPMNVYISTFRTGPSIQSEWDDTVTEMVTNIVGRSIFSPPGYTLEIDFQVRNFLVYKAVTVEVTQTIPVPAPGILALVGFPREAVLTQEARVIVSNADEFVRTVDIAMDLVTWVRNRFNKDNFRATIELSDDPRATGDFR